jgi:hypothetical protein
MFWSKPPWKLTTPATSLYRHWCIGGLRSPRLLSPCARSYSRAILGFCKTGRYGHTLLVANDDPLKQMVANGINPQEGRLTKVLGQIAGPADAMAIVLVEPIRPLLAMPLAMAPPAKQAAAGRNAPAGGGKDASCSRF